MKKLEGRVAVVTGAGSGIGEAMARAFASEGMRVAIADIEEEQAKRAAGELAADGARTLYQRADVSKPDSMNALADRVYADFGACHLLCNNAGVLVMGRLVTRSHQDWEWLLSVNLKGVVNGVLAFVPRMIEQGGEGHVVNTASINGLVAYPMVGTYVTTKYGVVGFTESLRQELEPHGIGVSVVCPGGIGTNLLDASRNRPEALGVSVISDAEIADVSASAGDDPTTVPSPDLVARAVLEGVRDNDLFVITHPEQRDQLIARHSAIMAAFDKAERRGE